MKGARNMSASQVTESTVDAVQDDGALRWLGVWFDRKLTFKVHVDKMATKARRTATGIRTLGNTVRGAPPRLLCDAVRVCVLPILCYSVEVWWPGMEWKLVNRIASNSMKGIVRRLDTI